MKLIDKRIYIGPNIYSYSKCMRLTVSLEEGENIATKDIKGFNERLLKSFEGLKRHCCCLGYEGGFKDRLEEGTYLPHVLEHVIIEMQNMLGFNEVKHGKARVVNDNIYYVIYQYELEEAGSLCGGYAMECLNSFIKGEDFDINKVMSQIEKEISGIRLGPSTLSIYKEAKKRGIPVSRLGNGSMLQLGYGIKQQITEATLTKFTSCIAVDIACNKAFTKDILSKASIPVARGSLAKNFEEAAKIAEEISYPVVVKPVDGNQGKGVSVNIKNEDELLFAYKFASDYNSNVIVEKYICGRDYRVLVIDKKVAAVALRMTPCVFGDGIHTIEELIEIENKSPLRGFDHEKPLTKIKVDNIVLNYLKNNNMSLNYIPKLHEKVILRFNANLSTGGVAKDCTDIIHPDNMEAAIKSAEAVGLDVAGVDICTRDISKSIYEEKGVVLEVNAAPGIRMHLYPSLGRSRNVASSIVDYIFKDKKDYSIPVVSITGTNGKTTTTRMVGHILSLSGKCVGMATTGGIYINGRLIQKGDTTGPGSAVAVLSNKDVEVAVLETARGGILRKGLGYDKADVGLITNISEDHLGIDGINTLEELINVKSLVLETVKDNGYAVINADESYANKLSEKVKSNIIYFSMQSDNLIIKKHMLDGGKAVFIKDGYICIGDCDNVKPLLAIKDIPSTLDSILNYNVQNAIAAVCISIALNVDEKTIVKGLKTFYQDEKQNPGRFNIYDFKRFKVVVDYGHNIDAYNEVITSLKKFDAKRLVGVIGVPGDRMDDSIIKIGEICGKAFDYIYVKEDADKRGRREGEVVKLLENGVKLSGKSKENYDTILNEGEAFKKALTHAQDGDIISVFFEDYDLIMKTLEEFKKANKNNKQDCRAV